MGRRIALGLLVSLVSTASSSTLGLAQMVVDDPVYPKPTLRLIAQAFADVYDPSALQLRGLTRQGNIVCGQFNGKNLYGAYVGFEPFGLDTDLKVLLVADVEANRFTGAVSFVEASVDDAYRAQISLVCRVSS